MKALTFIPIVFTFVLQNKTTELPKLKQHLKQTNPSWHVPDRRLRKFLKNHNAESETAKTIEEDSTLPKRRNFMGKLFPTKKQTVVTTAPMEEIITTQQEVVSPQAADDAVEAIPSPVAAMEQESKPAAASVATPKQQQQQSVGEDIIYKEDDDEGEGGTKGGMCAPCESCTMM